MPPIEIGPARPVGAVRPDTAITAASPAPQVAAPAASPVDQAAASAAAVQTSAALAPGKPPVDDNRVAQIRNAIQKGTYPLLPTRVADAMIAAGLMLSVRA